jgi:hypothetical protein
MSVKREMLRGILFSLCLFEVIKSSAIRVNVCVARFYR